MSKHSGHTAADSTPTARMQSPGWVSDFGQLVKFRLTSLVLFSAGMAYAIAAGADFQWSSLFMLLLGGFLVTGSANALNEVLERDYDRMMVRTSNRPVAAGRMSVSNAVLLAGLMALFGIALLSVFNPWTGFLGMLSLISYAFIYTPLKRITPLAVLVGAVPGALPLLIGTAVVDSGITSLGLFLFAVQFFWQFPHFWAVAWMGDADYKRAGYQLLPTKDGLLGPGVGFASLLFCILLQVNALAAWWIGLIGPLALLAISLTNVFFGWRCWQLFRTCSRDAARRQMFASFLHLPLTLVILLIEKW